MKKLKLGVFGALVFLVVADVALSFLQTGLANKPSANHPSYTIAESKARGAFIEAVSLTPAAIDWKGRRISVKEAWLEQQTELVRVYVFVPFVWERRVYRRAAGYNLCLNLDEGWDVLWGSRPPFFVAEGKQSGFSTRGTAVLWEQLSGLGQLPTRILVTDNWKLENSQIVVVKRQPG